MIYLGWLVVRWVMRAVIPATLLFGAGALLAGLVWLLFLRRQRRAAMALWVVVVSGAMGFFGWRTWEVWTDFTRPQVRMFRNYIADPIPKAVSDLSMATAAPAMFHDGALLRFHASEALVRQIAGHSLPGSTTLRVVEEMKRQSSRDPANRWVAAGADGRSYLEVDLVEFPKDGPEVFRWARSRVGEVVRHGAREVYVLLFEGEWGTFQSVLAYDPVKGTAEVHQYLERKRP